MTLSTPTQGLSYNDNNIPSNYNPSSQSSMYNNTTPNQQQQHSNNPYQQSRSNTSSTVPSLLFQQNNNPNANLSRGHRTTTSPSSSATRGRLQYPHMPGREGMLPQQQQQQYTSNRPYDRSPSPSSLPPPPPSLLSFPPPDHSSLSGLNILLKDYDDDDDMPPPTQSLATLIYSSPGGAMLTAKRGGMTPVSNGINNLQQSSLTPKSILKSGVKINPPQQFGSSATSSSSQKATGILRNNQDLGSSFFSNDGGVNSSGGILRSSPSNPPSLISDNASFSFSANSNIPNPSNIPQDSTLQLWVIIFGLPNDNPSTINSIIKRFESYGEIDNKILPSSNNTLNDANGAYTEYKSQSSRSIRNFLCLQFATPLQTEKALVQHFTSHINVVGGERFLLGVERMNRRRWDMLVLGDFRGVGCGIIGVGMNGGVAENPRLLNSQENLLFTPTSSNFNADTNTNNNINNDPNTSTPQKTNIHTPILRLRHISSKQGQGENNTPNNNRQDQGLTTATSSRGVNSNLDELMDNLLIPEKREKTWLEVGWEWIFE